MTQPLGAVPDPPGDDERAAALRYLEAQTGLQDVARIAQRGRNVDEARFTLQFTDGRRIHLGLFQGLCSQAKFAAALAVSSGYYPPAVKSADWRALVAMLVRHVVQVEDDTGESDADQLSEWLRTYAGRASEDETGAAPAGEPFLRDERLYVTASWLAKTIRREQGELVTLADLRQKLRDLGAVQDTIHYSRKVGKGAKRSSTSYYRLDLHAIQIESGNTP